LKRKKNTYYFCVLFFLFSTVMYSNGKKPPYPGQNGRDPYPELPIDGGVSFLLFAGAIYGAYKLRKK